MDINVGDKISSSPSTQKESVDDAIHVEEIEFDEPINLEEYDEFDLSFVLQRKLSAAESIKERSYVDGLNMDNQDDAIPHEKVACKDLIKNIGNLLNFKEDEEDIIRVEAILKKEYERKMAESLMESTANVDSEEEGEELNESSLKLPINSPPPPNELKRESSQVQWVSTGKIHESVYNKLRPNMAIQFPFELDDFQKQAVLRLERREHVFVAAHTSAGKTVVAEYGIALALKNNSRAVYTSPIKALSNQKYRDFKEKFGAENVGIVTGDVSVNPKAQCLIVTTEIFRSMLYKGADTVRDIEFVIFDEVHYVNDAERGVVWEEVIIMLPEKICLIFLSATTPNAPEFSEWIGRTKRKNVFLISTNKRPIPLQHYLFFDNEAFKLMDGEKQYNHTAISQAQNMMKEKSKPKPQTAENAKFASDRAGEKAARAAQAAGKDVAKQKQIAANVQKNSQSHKKSTATGNTPQKPSNPTGGKPQWLSLIKILQAGGREAAGGLGAINFGVATNGVLTPKARAEKNQREKYEKLPADIRAKMTKQEYESQEVRGDEDEPEGESGLLPVVVFSFSKKKCEEIADFLKGLNFLTRKEQGKVNMLFDQVVSRLNPVDVDLPQINRLKEMLGRGIGVHHGGLLPILKETVEILFSQSVVKVLLATETFAMGVNMPARSVVFNGFRKHDGREFRDLTPGEYIQMAGRAGRRGLDKVGTVVVAAWMDLPLDSQMKALMTGRPTLLASKFRLRYNMILNLVRVNNLSVQDMIKQSFTEFASQKALSNNDTMNKLKRYEAYLNHLENNEMIDEDASIYLPEVNVFVERFQDCQLLLHMQVQFLKAKRKKDVASMFSSGRLVRLQNKKTGAPCFAVILNDPNATKLLESKSRPLSAPSAASGVSSIAAARTAFLQQSSAPKPAAGAPAAVAGDAEIVPSVWALVLLNPADLPDSCASSPVSTIDQIDLKLLTEKYCCTSTGRYFLITKVAVRDIGLLYSAVLPLSVQTSGLDWLVEEMTGIVSSEAFQVDLLDLMKDDKINDLDFADRQQRLLIHAKEMRYFSQTVPCLSKLFAHESKIKKIRGKIDLIRRCVSDESMSLFPDFRQRIGILGLLAYLDPDCKVITRKGRVACEMNSCDELLGAEILFHNVLEPLNPPEAVAMLSALVFQEKNEVEEQLTSRMEVAKAKMIEIYQQLSTLQEIERVEIDSDAKPILNFGLCGVVYQWARGVSFKDITQITEFQEGSIVRAITRLDELCRDVQKAARVMGNPSLYNKMEAASLCIKRDIIFAGSLYIS